MSWISKFFSFREQSEGDVIKPFLEHLEDLRVTIMKMAVSLVVGMVVAFSFRDRLMVLIRKPIDGLPDVKIFAPELMTGFMMSLKLAFYAGIVISFPALLYFVAEFVLPALTRKERRMLLPGILGGFILFAGGVLASYYYILPKTVQWFYQYTTGMGVSVFLDLGKYFSFVANLLLACGLLCELPIVIIVLSLINIVSYSLLARTRPYAVTLILILVAVIAPSPDPFTFITLSLPVLAIYELCIWIVWLIERRKKNLEKSA